MLSYSQAELGRELTQPCPGLLAEPCISQLFKVYVFRTGTNEAAVDAALDATREIADKCKLEIPMGQLLMPHFPIPDAFNNDTGAFLQHLTYEGAKKRWPEITETIRERLDLELRGTSARRNSSWKSVASLI